MTNVAGQAPGPKPGARDGATPPGTSLWMPADGRVKNVLLLADGEKPLVTENIGAVKELLAASCDRVEVRTNVREIQFDGSFALDDQPDLVVVLGGDGSVLTACRLFQNAPVATIGINYGRVGFLASLESSAWREGLTEVLEGRALVEQRMRLRATVLRGDGGGGTEGASAIAMNDVVISRGGTPSMAKFELISAGRAVTSYRADGLIFATPSGSTAYSLAAGGPILDPALRAIVLTPISAHALSHRPLVLGSRAVLEARVVDIAGAVTLDIDGRFVSELQGGDAVRLEACEDAYPLLTTRSFDPWQRLRDRLGWAGHFDGE
ncbi:putative inorganic polyphosphate/ATP-NAD kinase [Planctomycetes bacterium Poly30]|uniref:NAD kinase n=1 Tax=Saltatorellus ferox TaxID=2528018 RepID=A0A518ETL0_9BACT|nr:putative inorganic polyphosphate/ATP-NAD kinase [Planctomycetes bacterium Poly30]